MQNFEDHQMYPTPYVYMDDPLRLCREEGKFKPACYLYAGAYLAEHFEGESGIFQVCAGAEEDRVIECVRGIGHFLIGNYLDDKDQAIAICDSATSEQVKNACIDGLVSYHLVIYNSVSTTETFCASFPEEDQDTCMASVEARKMFYLEESKTNL